MCSTPNGIKGTYTFRCQVCRQHVRGAQRLTASKEPTPYNKFNPVAPDECSTPNGIKGTYTAFGPSPPPGPYLCSTPNGIKGTYAVVLPFKSGLMIRAQRLTASKEPTQAIGHFQGVRSVVCSTPNGIKGTYTMRCPSTCAAGKVLNA